MATLSVAAVFSLIIILGAGIGMVALVAKLIHDDLWELLDVLMFLGLGFLAATGVLVLVSAKALEDHYS